MKFVRISEQFEFSEFELSGVNHLKMCYQIQGELDLVRVSGEFDFELAGFYPIYIYREREREYYMVARKYEIYFEC